MRQFIYFLEIGLFGLIHNFRGSYSRSVGRNTGSASPPTEETSTMKKLTNTLFRKSKSREKVNDVGGYKANVILR